MPDAARRRCTTELAGLGFDSTLLRFVKQHLQLFRAWPVSDSVTFSIGAAPGLSIPVGLYPGRIILLRVLDPGSPSLHQLNFLRVSYISWRKCQSSCISRFKEQLN